MTLADLDLVLGWAAAEGWNPGLDDAAAFLSADPEGFFVAERDGVPVAAISVVNHDPGQAFLGLYICRPAFRGQGIGLALWHHALAHAGTRTVGLDGVAAQQANYAASGFRRSGATLRWEGPLAGAAATNVRPAAAADLPALMRLDAAANGHARPGFLHGWLAASETRRSFVLDGTDGPAGFATIRRCCNGSKLGPVIAPDAAAALRLIRAALAATGEALAVIDIPDASADFAARLAAAGLAETFRTARMYRGAPPCPGPLLQAVGTLELG